MMKNVTWRRMVVALVASLVWSTSNVRTVTAANVYVDGYGNQLCSQWLAYGKTNKLQQDVALEWVRGFVTGHNYYVSNTSTKTDRESTRHFVTQYCERQPLHRLFMAAAALVEEAGGRAAIHKWKK